MSEEIQNLRYDIRRFEDVIRNLSQGVKGCGISWRDAQYAQLAEKINAIAVSSSGVIQAGQSCENALKQFESIASEV